MLNIGAFQESHTENQNVSVRWKLGLKDMSSKQLPKTRMSGSARIFLGNEFHAAGPACEIARSANLVRSCGSEKLVPSVVDWH